MAVIDLSKYHKTGIVLRDDSGFVAPEKKDVDLKKVKDDKMYRVTLSRGVSFLHLALDPSHDHVLTGQVVKTILSKPENEGAISAVEPELG